MKSISFKPNESKGPVVVLIGRRDTGKSFLVRDLLYHHQDIPIGTVISGTEAGNGFYAKHIPKLFIHDEYNTAIIENILKRQKTVLKQVKKEIDQYRKSNIDPRAFVILDDCLYDKSWINEESTRYIFMNGRHIDMTFIYTAQTATNLLPALRQQLDYVFMFFLPGLANRKKLYENYASIFPTFESFNQVYDSCTQNFECLVIDNTVRSNRLEDQIAWYKADPSIYESDFRICPKEYWDLSQEIGEPCEEEDENDEFDPTIFQKSKTTPQITIQKSN